MRMAECVSADASLGSTPGDADSSNISSSLFSSSSATLDYSSFHDPPSTQNAFGRREARVAAPDLMKFHKALNNSLLISSNSKRDQSQECQQRRSDCHTPLSLDLNNNVAACSPRKHCSGALTSPVTPNYRQTGDGLNKGWSSERVPLPQNENRRQVGGTHFSFNHGGRGTLPSKWEDAERWIFGPATADTGLKQAVPQTERRLRSKSGPLGASGVFYYSAHSPAVHTFDGIHGSNLLAGSPFSARIMPGHSVQTGYACNSGCPGDNDMGITRSVSIHGCAPELLNRFSMPCSPRMDEEYDDDVKNAASGISRAVSRRDMATQMSPDDSPCSSSRRKHSVSSSLSMVEIRRSNSPRLDVRDVEVDERVTDTVTRWSMKKKSHRRGNENVDSWASKSATTWDVSETPQNISKVRKEEARIAAWENLQKAKAEAAVKKLEMKLEKRRSSSMDNIMNKLRLAQKKGQEMRRAVLANQAQQISNSSNNKTVSLRPMSSSLSSCFTCHAFNNTSKKATKELNLV